MSIYVIPPLNPTGSSSQLVDILTEEGLTLHVNEKLRPVILHREDEMYITTLTERTLNVLVSLGKTLLPEEVYVITNAPDLVYPVAWLSAASGLQEVDWEDVIQRVKPIRKEKEPSVLSENGSIDDLNSLDGDTL